MTVSSSTLDKICDCYEYDELKKVMDKNHVQVGANSKTVWFFQHNWDHVFAKVKHHHHGDLKLSIRDHKKFAQLFPEHSDFYKTAMKIVAGALFEKNR